MKAYARGRALVARAGVLALVAGGMTALAVGPAQADTFTPGNSTPTVGSVTTGMSITPTTGGSTVQQIDATVGDADSLLDLDTVVLCFYKTTGGDSTCASTDAQNTMKLVWTRSTNAFVLTAGTTTTWVNSASTTTTYSPTGTSMVVNFKFTAGRAALQGGWTGKVTATDVSAATANASGTHTVNYFASITTREAQAFGTVAAAGTATAENISNGSIVANASTNVTMLQTAFAGTSGNAVGTSGGVMTGTPVTAVTATNVALDCGNAATYAGSSGQIRLTTSAQNLQTAQLAAGTAEAGVTSLVNSCRLTSGGQLPIGEYTATVTTGVGAAQSTSCSTFSVGQSGPGGGTIFYKDLGRSPGSQCFEAAPTNWAGAGGDPTKVWALSSSACWDNIAAAQNTAIGTGAANTTAITNLCPTATDAPAASATRNYTGGSLSDWFLPSKDELNQLCKYARGQSTAVANQAVVCDSTGTLAVGFAANFYWSSSQYSSLAGAAWLQNFGFGYQDNGVKYSNSLPVRPVRAF